MNKKRCIICGRKLKENSKCSSEECPYIAEERNTQKENQENGGKE